MKIKNLFKILPVAIFLSIGAVSSFYFDGNTPIEVNAASDLSTEYSGYYANVDTSSGGTNGTLRKSLTSLIQPKAYYSYSGSSQGDLGYELRYYDEDPNNSNNMIMFYTQESITKVSSSGSTWNREHSWPQSNSGGLYGESKGGADLLHIRPTRHATNSKRSNSVYGEVSGSYLTYNGYEYGKSSGGVFEPTDKVKGDAARITFYMWVCYFAERGTPITNNCTNVETLLRWHELDPVSEQEMMRNNRVQQSKQKNRNPFVDHPEWAREIFG